MNRKYYADAQGAACADEHLARTVNSDENDLQEQDSDNLILPDETDSKTCISISILESSDVMPSKSHSGPAIKSREAMIHSISITLRQSVWSVQVEPDKDIEGMVTATITTQSSTEPLSSEVNRCCVADLESVIRRNLRQVVGENKHGTLEGRIEYLVGREETETERYAREILCRLFRING